jgi:diaminohydroxyphosphoribosylaminopyrimidine deaminase/5-amino-6-(5-phosphoribosylamino)uracil reductase
MALAQAAHAASGGTAYVTLEPCAHIGHTPPCCEALTRAGIKRVVAALEDPDPRVNGRGFADLRAAGIQVTAGVLKQEASDLNAGFLLRTQQSRPLVTLKIAQSRDSKTVVPPGANRWITGEAARRYAHLLRAQHDAILIGIGTALADDPELTCRLPGLECRSPMRIVLDAELRLPVSAKLVQGARTIPTLVFTSRDDGNSLRARGVEVLRLTHDLFGQPALAAVLEVLARRGVTRLLVEGGLTVWTAFLRGGLADRLEIFTAPTELGPKGGGYVARALDLTRFVRRQERQLGRDLLETYAATA